MYTVYAIYNPQNDKIYIGQTENLKRRLLDHSARTFKKGYTARFDGDWVLIYSESVCTREEALRREKQLKSYRGREFIRTYLPG